VYDNVLTFTASGENYPLNLNYFFYVRGGTGVIANNVFPHVGSQMWGQKAEILMTVFNIRRSSQFVPCQTSYPASRQIGRTYRNGAMLTDPLYLWGNTGGGNYDNPGIVDYEPDECGNGQLVANYIKAGRDYIIGTAKPGYSAYPYPHPLPKAIPSPKLPASSGSIGSHPRQGPPSHRTGL